MAPRYPHPLSLLPRPISHFLGYRKPGTSAPVTPPPSLKKALTLTISLVFAFAGLAVLQSVFRYDMHFTDRGLPYFITSYGATAILVYGVPASPFAQPRSVIGGQFFSALVGLIVYELFSLMPPGNFQTTNWLGGALATAIALVVMDLTGTTHPPAGATALLPVIQADIIQLGWDLLWITILSSVLLVAVGCIANNILGRYPTFWFRAEPIPWFSGDASQEAKKSHDINELKAVANGDTADAIGVNGRNSNNGSAGSSGTQVVQGNGDARNGGVV